MRAETPDIPFMLAIPDLNLILIQPPRTASTALRAALERRYPNIRRLYRHMERDGIPDDYSDWRVACTVRRPLERLHSTWRYMRAQGPDSHADTAWTTRVSADADRPFTDWVLNSLDPFTTPVDPEIPDAYLHRVRHFRPVARKSLWWWARPDLGPVTLLKMEDHDHLQHILGVRPDRAARNAAPGCIMDSPCDAVSAHVETWFSWDLSLYNSCFSRDVAGPPFRVSQTHRATLTPEIFDNRCNMSSADSGPDPGNRHPG